MCIRKFLPGVLILCVVITGCASSVTHPKAVTQSGFLCSADNPLGDIEVTLTAEGKADLAENLKFDPQELKNHIERALVGNSLLIKESRESLPRLVVEVKDIRVRSNFSAVMWGFMAGNDHIVGDVVVRDSGGNELDRFEVSASYALGGLAGGMDSARMGWLYETFAEETIKELTKQTTAGAENAETADLKIGDIVKAEFHSGTTREITITNVTPTTINGYFSDSAQRASPRTFDRSEIQRLTLLKREN